jgi:hypothetical protein
MKHQELQELWRALFRTEPPPEQQWVIWSNLHDEGIVRDGLLQLAVKHRKMAGTMTADHMIRFCSAVMNRLTSERNEAINKLKKPFLGRAVDTAVIVTGTEPEEVNGNI